ncbi:hypothetical protein E2C06_24135 [Dankookia rubra]|uniref:Uncharacterized protein n=1 Tax=Dankookia rubra TaxID=1442381 RepID=A0A4R5QAG6_9PROT|nr:hypothetical protein [Dankookia rubra]TDH60040.1 hypothetical protein E2C06_24135 [Dankookia rubra]
MGMLALLGACGGSDRGCPGVLANASGQPLEQFYLAHEGAGGWGEDLLPDRDLPPGASLPFRFPAEGHYGLRAVWTNGRAAEMQGVEACRTTRVTLRDGSMQAE